MSIVQKLGSFPNSQVKPRSPVRDATMIDIALPTPGLEVQILVKNTNRVLAIIKNSGDFDVEIDYTAGASDAFTLGPGSALTVEGGEDDVFATAIGSAGALEIDDRIG